MSLSSRVGRARRVTGFAESAAVVVALWAALSAGSAFAAGGEYTISGLPSGTYNLVFSPINFGPGEHSGNYLRQWYSGRPNREGAGTVTHRRQASIQRG